MVMHILDQEANGLAEKLQLLSLEQQRTIVTKGCNLVSQSMTNLQPATRYFLELATADKSLTISQIEETKLLADSADERYFILQEEGASETEWLNWFSEARLLTAIADGLGGTSWQDAADAIYELCKAWDDPSPIIAFIESEVKAVLKENEKTHF